MYIAEKQISKAEVFENAEFFFDDLGMVKAVVDIDRGLLALDADLHADLEGLLLQDGSEQESLWGINLYQDVDDEFFIEYDSLINIRPRQGNRSRGVDDERIRARITEVISRWIL